jgi:hypothetical protein
MYLIDTEITCRWKLAPTGSPVPEANYDIRVVPPGLSGTYTDSGIVDYVAPSANYGGSLAYKFTPTVNGLFKVTLSIGTGANYQVIGEKKLWVFSSAPTSVGSTLVSSALASTPVYTGSVRLTTGTSPTEYGLYSIATDGTKIVVAGTQTGGVNKGTFHTDMQFQGWTYNAKDLTVDTPYWPHITYGNGKWILTGYYGKEIWHSTDAINWTLATTIPTTSAGVVNHLAYLANKDVFIMARGSGILYSINGGVTWIDQIVDIPTFPPVGVYSLLENPMTFNNFTLMGMGQERLMYTNNTTQDMSNWTIFTDTNLWASVRGLHFLDTDGTKIVTMSQFWDQAESTDVVTWSANTMTSTDTLTTAILWFGYMPSAGKWYVITQDSTDPIFESDDARDWSVTHSSVLEPLFITKKNYDSKLMRLPNGGWAIVWADGITSGVSYQV